MLSTRSTADCLIGKKPIWRATRCWLNFSAIEWNSLRLPQNWRMPLPGCFRSLELQWLVMASQFDGKLPIADLYANSVSYSSGKKGFFLGHDKAGKAEHRPVEMWNFLVDCFAGEEDYRSNIFCETFRCPQIVTNQLQAVLPSENWLGEFLHQRRHLGLRKGAKPPPGSHYSVKRDIIWRKPYAKRMLATYYDEVEKGIYKLKDGLCADRTVKPPKRICSDRVGKIWQTPAALQEER